MLLGVVYIYDVFWYCGCDVVDLYLISIECFVVDLGDVVLVLGVLIRMVGYLMGVLYLWCLVVECLELVLVLVVEDMVLDFCGRIIGLWELWLCVFLVEFDFVE